MTIHPKSDAAKQPRTALSWLPADVGQVDLLNSASHEHTSALVLHAMTCTAVLRMLTERRSFSQLLPALSSLCSVCRCSK